MTGVGGWWAWVGRQSQTRADQQTQFYQQVISECQSLRSGNTDLQKQIIELQNEVHLLREKLEYYEENPGVQHARELLEAVFCSNDEVSWIHDLSNNKWYLSDAYCRELSVIRSSFWTPVNIFGRFPVDDALRYAQNDYKVVETNTTIEFTEKVRKRVMDPNCDLFLEGVFRKTPVVINSKPYVIGKLLYWLPDQNIITPQRPALEN